MNTPNRYLTERGTLDESRLYRDADKITQGASNPLAVTGVLYEMMQALYRTGKDTRGICEHPAIVCVLDQLHNIVLGRTSDAVPSSAYQLLINAAVESHRND